MKRINIVLEENGYHVNEEIKSLRTNLMFCGVDKKVILVTSALPGEGKSSTALQLAKSLADMGKAVVLVDADIRKSVMVNRLQITSEQLGLSHFLSGQCTLAEALVATNVPKMHLLLSGPSTPNPTELLESARFHGMIESMRNVYDYVIIDCAPLGMVIDSAIVAKEADGAIIVVEAGKTKYRIVQEVKRRLMVTNIPVLGVVLNKVDTSKSAGYYHKYYGNKSYGKYYGNKEQEAVAD